MIPKILHLMWIGPHPKPSKLIDTWYNMNPDWEIMQWDEEKLKKETFVNQRLIDNCPQYNGKKDIMSFEILKKYGGFFVDADSDCIRPLDDFLLENDSFACWESEQATPGLIAVGYLAATKGNKLMDLLIEGLKGLDRVQLSSVVTEVLNYNRTKTSTLGFKRPQQVEKLEKRNIVV